MSQIFHFSQSEEGQTRLAFLKVPGTGRNEKDDAPVIIAEIEGGNIVLNVYADIQSKEPTHTISLNGAKLGYKNGTSSS